MESGMRERVRLYYNEAGKRSIGQCEHCDSAGSPSGTGEICEGVK